MERRILDLEDARVFSLVRGLVAHWPPCALRDRLERDWVGTDHISRAVLVTRLGVPRAGLTPAQYASALVVAYIKSL